MTLVPTAHRLATSAMNRPKAPLAFLRNPNGTIPTSHT